MVFHDKPIGSCALFFQSTAGKIKGTVANTAIKMVVMPPTSPFIQSPERWMGDSFQPPVIDQKLEIPVDCCLVERFHEFATVLYNFIHAQGSFVLSEDLLYSLSLCGVASQSLILHIQKDSFCLFLLQVLSQ